MHVADQPVTNEMKMQEGRWCRKPDFTSEAAPSHLSCSNARLLL